MAEEDPVRRAVRELGHAQTQHLNRLLACEALLHALLLRLDPRAAAGVAEEYDQALDCMAAQLAPSLQMPDLWRPFADALEAVRWPAAPDRPAAPPGAG